MQFFKILILLILFYSCSFDTKTGIWKNEKNISDESNNKNTFKEFKKISISDESFKETIHFNEEYNFTISEPVSNQSWNDVFFNKNNNYDNFNYSNLNQIEFKSKKLSRYKVGEYKLFEDGNIIINDNKGNIIVFSLKENKIISKFNFYKKKFKKIKKKLNFIVEKNIIFVADNLGYLYAYNYKIKNVLWAKNYKIPFSSNLKISDNKLIVSNQNNNLYLINKNNGELLKQIPTEETFVKNQFENNLSTFGDKLFFLNSYGSLYSIDLSSMRINWFINLNQSLELSASNLFSGNKIVTNGNLIIISSKSKTYIIENNSGNIIKKFDFSSFIKPIIYNNALFFLTKNNFLVSIDLDTQNILYSFDIGSIKDIDNKKIKYFKYFKQLMILNNQIFIFLNDSKFLSFSLDGKYKELIKVKSKISTLPISIDNRLLFLSNNNKLLVLN